MKDKTDAVVVGGGLAGLVAASELAAAGRRVVILEQEPEASLGGQAFWSLGGLFLVNSPEQRRLGVRDSFDLAMRDWIGTAGFDRTEDHWPRRWAEAYVAWAAGEKRAWLRSLGIGFFPIVGWAERRAASVEHGNSVPRFHIVWGTGPGVLEPFVERARDAQRRGLITLRFRHRVTEIVMSGGTATGVRGTVLEPSSVPRGLSSLRRAVGEFAIDAQAVIVTAGGIGGNHDLVRRSWPSRLGAPPARMLSGVPDYVDGQMLGACEAAGAAVINRDRMWHYVEGLRNWNPIWPNHGIRILPGPSSLWLDATGNRLPAPLFPGFDTLGTLAHIGASGFDYSWFVLTRKIIEKEFALSGSEQNPDLTNRSWRQVMGRVRGGAPGPVRAFMERGADFIVERKLDDLVRRMNKLAGEERLDASSIERIVASRDRELDNEFTTDAQLLAIADARRFIGDRLIRTAKPHRILDSDAGPLIAVRLSILTRKTLGGLATDLGARVLRADGSTIPGLYAAGEIAGFGGGGMHGYRALEGTFLGGCLFSGRTAGRAAAAAIL
ncbi:MAG TPA: FAD-binding dehydrogenase [Gemmatimonadaceae bacterium]|jgi:predicted oxidoreductase|nr:FAD-binding dehydrogenase [Gemmatimonadaceae bacterium]